MEERSTLVGGGRTKVGGFDAMHRPRLRRGERHAKSVALPPSRSFVPASSGLERRTAWPLPAERRRPRLEGSRSQDRAAPTSVRPCPVRGEECDGVAAAAHPNSSQARRIRGRSGGGYRASPPEQHRGRVVTSGTRFHTTARGARNAAHHVRGSAIRLRPVDLRRELVGVRFDHPAVPDGRVLAVSLQRQHSDRAGVGIDDHQLADLVGGVERQLLPGLRRARRRGRKSAATARPPRAAPGQ
jgi:hypothetical protein